VFFEFICERRGELRDPASGYCSCSPGYPGPGARLIEPACIRLPNYRTCAGVVQQYGAIYYAAGGSQGKRACGRGVWPFLIR